MSSSIAHDRRAWIGGGAVVALLIVAVSWFLVISPELSSADDKRAQTANADLQNSLLIAKNAKLRKEFENIDSLRAQLASKFKALPMNSGLPAFTRELTAQSLASGIEIKNINVGGISSATTATATTTTTSEDGSTTPTPTPSSTSTATTATTPTSAGSLFVIPVSVTAQGTLDHLVAFIKSVENGDRRALVQSTQISVNSTGRIQSVDNGANLSMQISVFSAPMSPDDVAQVKKLLASDGN